MNISYTRKGDYLLPDLKLKDKERFNIGKYGLLKLEYLKKNKRGLYTELLMNDKLNEYLHDVDIIANSRINNLILLLAEKENIDEKLKQNNQILWVGKMNNIKKYSWRNSFERTNLWRIMMISGKKDIKDE